MAAHLSPDEFWSAKRRGTVLIVGLSERTGVPAARLLDAQGVHYKVSDSASRDELAPRLAGLGVADADVFAGPQEAEQLDGVTELLLAPGVPRSVPLVREALRRAIPVQVDLDFAFDLMAKKRLVAITGTDGKTTTVTLTGELLRSLGPVVVAGNIGVSVLEKLDEIQTCDWVVLEVSSFMLEGIARFRPHLGAILNIAEDHIDRYASLEEYAAVKLDLVKHCERGDVLVLNADDPILSRAAPAGATVRWVSQLRRDADAFFSNGQFHVGGQSFAYADCRLAGVGNVDNILVAATLAHEAGVAGPQIAATVRTFDGIAHRLEHLGRFRGVDVYEDSKASNVHAVDTALRNFAHNVVLILGGRDKGLDFSPLRAHAPRLRRLVCYGEDGEKIRDALDLPGSLYAYSFAAAVELAARQCQPGDVLLLSPGCTSWDQFDNYEVRGDVFRRLVQRALCEPGGPE